MAFLKLLAVAAAVLFAVAAALPDGVLQRGGELLRRAGDVTPERVLRWRLWHAAMACGFAMAAWLLHRHRAAAGAFLIDARGELAGLPGELRAAWRTWPTNVKVWWLIAVAVGIALRLKHLQVPMAYDEAYSFTNFARRPLWEALADYNNTNNHLLNTLGMHVCWKLFGNHEWALRLPALLAGIACLMIAVPWAARRIGLHGGVVAMAFLAASPMLVDYSVNARGYTMMLAAALLVDWCFQRIHERGTKVVSWERERPVSAAASLANPAPHPSPPPAAGGGSGMSWLGAWLGIVLGLFAVPVMLHPLAGICLWFALVPRWERQSAWRRWRGLVLLLAAAGLATALLYGPGYIFRGHQAGKHEFVQPLPLGQWAMEFPGAFFAGAARWTPWPDRGTAAYFIIATFGLIEFLRCRGAGFATACVFAGGLGMLALQRVAPPPRMFLFLTPWFAMLVAITILDPFGGIRHAAHKIEWQPDSGPRPRSAKWLGWCLFATLLLPGAWTCWSEPILREPHQRDVGIGSVPEAVRWLKDHAGPGQRRLLAPLPLDHPAIYYADRFSVPLPINGDSQPGETVWRLAVPNAPKDAAWTVAAEFAELRLERRR